MSGGLCPQFYLLPGRLMAGQRPLEPSVEVRVLPGQLDRFGTTQTLRDVAKSRVTYRDIYW